MSKKHSKKNTSPLWLVPVFILVVFLIGVGLYLSSPKQPEYPLPERLSRELGPLPDPNWQSEQADGYHSTVCGDFDLDFGDTRLEVDLNLLYSLVETYCAGKIFNHLGVYFNQEATSHMKTQVYPGFEWAQFPADYITFFSEATITSFEYGDVFIVMPTGAYEKGRVEFYSNDVGRKNFAMNSDQALTSFFIHEFVGHALPRAAGIPSMGQQEEYQVRVFEEIIFEELQNQGRLLIRFK